MGTFVLAALLADWLGWAFVMTGVEHFGIKPGITATNALDLYDYPWSHSLLMDLVWAGLFAAGYYAFRKCARAAWIIFAVVLSHWVLDWISHRPDMPLAPGLHVYLGLGLFNSRLGMLLVEGGMWLAGVVIYERATRSRGRAGIWVFYVVVTLLTLLWLPSLNGAPPPVTIQTMARIDVIMIGVLVAWAYWADSLRVPTVPGQLASPAHQAG